jgi:acyl-CoA thioester hydrolase
MNSHSPATAAPYPCTVTLPVAFRDIDALGHVNHAVYITWCETVRTIYVAELCEVGDPRALPIILAEITCRYAAPGFWGESVVLGCGVSRLGTKSFDLGYGIATTEGRLLATARSIQVYYDYQAQQTVPVPAQFRERVAARQGDWAPPAGGHD